MGETGAFTLSYREYCSWAKTYKMRIRSLFIPPFAPVYYCMVSSRIDDERIALLWLDNAREKWVAFAPDEIEEDVAALFS